MGSLVLQSLQACLRRSTRILALAFMSPSNLAFLFPLQLLSLPGPLRANTIKQEGYASHVIFMTTLWGQVKVMMWNLGHSLVQWLSQSHTAI